MTAAEHKGKRGPKIETIDRLSKRFGKYALVSAVAKRARELKERQARLPASEETGKLILRAIDEIKKGRVKVKPQPPKE